MRGESCAKSAAPDLPQLHVKRQLGVTKERTTFRLNDVSPDVVIAPFNNDIDTLERAVKERVFFVKGKDGNFMAPPRPAPGHFANELASSLAQLRRFLPSTAPMTHQQFVDQVRGRKKKMYEQALERIHTEGLNLQRDAQVKVFVKCEKTDRTSKADPVPRVISPRDPKYNITVGRYLRKVEDRIFKALGKLFGHTTVMKGMDTSCVARQLREKWDMFNNPVAVGLDASRFDQHVSKEALETEHGVYLDCFPLKRHKDKLKRILSHQLVNRCFGTVADGTISYTVEGTRMSGDMNTSLGNCVLMCLMIHRYAATRGVRCQLANNGDDCVVFMERDQLEQFSQGLDDWFLAMGFNMVVEKPAFEFEHIEFCQTRPVFDGVAYTMSRNPFTAIAKDSVCLKGLEFAKLLPVWMQAVGKGGVALAGGLPIFQSFYSSLVRSGTASYKNAHGKRTSLDEMTELLPWYMREHGIGGARTFSEVTPACRSSFYSAWGITPDEQISLERYYDGLSLSTAVCGGEWRYRAIFPDY